MKKTVLLVGVKKDDTLYKRLVNDKWCVRTLKYDVVAWMGVARSLGFITKHIINGYLYNEIKGGRRKILSVIKGLSIASEEKRAGTNVCVSIIDNLSFLNEIGLVCGKSEYRTVGAQCMNL